MSKNLYCIRHGLSLHNKLYHKHGSKTFYDKDYIDIYSLSLEDIMEHGEWRYEWITNKQAEEYNDNRY